MRVLGLCAFHGDSAAVLVVDGEPVSAACEGWFTRKQPEHAFPRRAARECLRSAGVRAVDLDAVVLARKPLLEFERVLVSHLRAFPRSANGFARSMFLWLGDRLWMRNRLASELEIPPERTRFVAHARALCAASWYQAPFQEAALLCIDGAGEWSAASLGRAGPGGIEILAEQDHPDSLALLAAAVAQWMGLDPERDARRLEGLAGEGEARLLEPLAALVPAAADGSIRLLPGVVALDGKGGTRFGPELERVFGPAREAGQSPGAAEAEVAASLQALLEARTLGLAQELGARSASPALCLAGSLFRNGRLLARLAEEGPFESLFVPPAPDGAAAALGAAWLVAAELGDAPQRGRPLREGGGPHTSGAQAPEVRARELDGAGAVRAELLARLTRGEAVAWMRGAPEWGCASRARRCVLRDAQGPDARVALLATLGRVGPGHEACLLVPAERLRELVAGTPSARQLEDLGWWAPRAQAELRRWAPSAIAADGRVPVRAVSAQDDPELHALLLGHGAARGAPLLLEIPFVPRGAAPALSLADALEVWQRSQVPALIAENWLYGA